MLAPAFNLQAVQTTTHPCSPLVIVNGPPGSGIYSGVTPTLYYLPYPGPSAAAETARYSA